MSILYKYNNDLNFLKKIKTPVHKIYLQKYFKPYKTPLRLVLIYISNIYLNFDVIFKKTFKSILNLNTQTLKFSHSFFLQEILVN